MSSDLFCCSPPYFVFETGSLFAPGVHHSVTRWPLSSKDLPVSAPPVLGIRPNVSMHDFYMGGDDLNSAACY